MGWLRITIFCFECDWPGCTTAYEGLGLAFGGSFWGAVKEIQLAGWQVRMLRRGRTFYCPSHREG